MSLAKAEVWGNREGFPELQYGDRLLSWTTEPSDVRFKLLGEHRGVLRKDADSERMSRGSKRNVFPSKIALGFMFAILGVLVLPGPGAWLAELVGRAM